MRRERKKVAFAQHPAIQLFAQSGFDYADGCPSREVVQFKRIAFQIVQFEDWTRILEIDSLMNCRESSVIASRFDGVPGNVLRRHVHGHVTAFRYGVVNKVVAFRCDGTGEVEAVRTCDRAEVPASLPEDLLPAIEGLP